MHHARLAFLAVCSLGLLGLSGCASCGCDDEDDGFPVHVSCQPRKGHTHCTFEDRVEAGLMEGLLSLGWEMACDFVKDLKHHHRHREEARHHKTVSPPRPIGWDSPEGRWLRAGGPTWPCRAAPDESKMGPPAPEGEP
jgi:hypothetical protein